MEAHGPLPVPHAQNVINTVAARSGGRVILFYSGGKDSLALLDLCVKSGRFSEIVCVFMYFVPGLEHCEIYLRYAAGLPGVRVVQYEHPSLTLIRRNGTYCKAEPKTKLRSLKDVAGDVVKETGIAWSIYGMKKADSLNRRSWLAALELEAIEASTSKAYPLTYWTNKLVENYQQRQRLPTPIKYGGKASNGVGFNLDCFLYLRKYYPQDLERIYSHFPASRQILFEYDFQQSQA